MTDLIATDLQTQQVGELSSQTAAAANSLVELFEITLPNGETLHFHPGLDDDLTNIRFRNIDPPTTTPIAAGSFITGNSYTISVPGNTDFTAIGAANSNASTTFTATGAGSGSGTAVQNDHSIVEYTAFPMAIDGLDLRSDGATARPSLTIANLGILFSNVLGDFKFDDLVGERIIRRQTLKKYLVGESEDASPSIEMGKQEYIIDRVAQETNTTVTFEVAVPFDLENITLPRRVINGKYCSWRYQGHFSTVNPSGGCTWKLNSSVNFFNTSDDDTYNHRAYFDVNDSPLIDNTKLGANNVADWSSSTTYTTDKYVYFPTGQTAIVYQCIIGNSNKEPATTTGFWKRAFTYVAWSTSGGGNWTLGDHVLYGTTSSVETVWKCIATHAKSASTAPADKSSLWVRADVCGKTLKSCSCRFGFDPVLDGADDAFPDGSKNDSVFLPFGGFPGTAKY